MTARRAHPSVFLFLYLPFGVVGGYLQVSIAYLLAQAGVPVQRVAALVAVSLVPHTWKSAWAPIADITLSRKSWYVIGAALTAVGLWVTGSLPASAAGLRALTVVVVISNVALAFLGMSVESLMAYPTSEE